MRKRFGFFLVVFTIINIPTIIVQFRGFYKWGSWYVHKPVGMKEIIFHQLFQIADFIANTVIFIMPISMLLSTLMAFEILRYIRKNEIRKRKRILLISYIVLFFTVSVMSFLTIIFLPIFWI